MASKHNISNTKSYDDMLEETKKELDIFGQMLVVGTKNKLSLKKMNSTGKLGESIRYDIVEQEDGNLVFQYTMFDYGYYQDEGVGGANPQLVKGINKAPNSRFKMGKGKGKGKGKLREAISKWIRAKGIIGLPRKGRNAPTHDQLVFLISRSIWAQGLEPKLFFTNTWNEQTQLIEDKLIKSVLKDAEKLFIATT